MSESPCACPSTDAHRCYEIRYPAPIDDLDRSYYFERIQEDDCRCECGCHGPAEFEGPNGECPICGEIQCKPGCADGSEML